MADNEKYYEDAEYMRSFGMVAQRQAFLEENDTSEIEDVVGGDSINSIIDYDVYNNVSYDNDDDGFFGEDNDTIIKDISNEALGKIFDGFEDLFDDINERDEAFQSILFYTLLRMSESLDKISDSGNSSVNIIRKFKHAQEYAWRHPVLTGATIAAALVKGTYRNIFKPLLFGMDDTESGIKKVDNSVQELIELERTGQIKRERSFWQQLKGRGILGSLGHMALGSMGISRDLAQQREEDRRDFGEARTVGGGRDISDAKGITGIIAKTQQKLSERFYRSEINRYRVGGGQAGSGLDIDGVKSKLDDIHEGVDGDDINKHRQFMESTLNRIHTSLTDGNSGGAYSLLEEIVETNHEAQDIREDILRESVRQRMARLAQAGLGLVGSLVSTLGNLFSGFLTSQRILLGMQGGMIQKKLLESTALKNLMKKITGIGMIGAALLAVKSKVGKIGDLVTKGTTLLGRSATATQAAKGATAQTQVAQTQRGSSILGETAKGATATQATKGATTTQAARGATAQTQTAQTQRGNSILGETAKGFGKILKVLAPILALTSQFDEHAAEKYAMRFGQDPNEVSNMSVGKRIALRTGGFLTDTLDEASFGVLGKTIYRDKNFDQDELQNKDKKISDLQNGRVHDGSLTAADRSNKNKTTVSSRLESREYKRNSGNMNDGGSENIKEAADTFKRSIDDMTKNMSGTQAPAKQNIDVNLSRNSERKIQELTNTVNTLSRTVNVLAQGMAGQSRTSSSDIMAQAR